MPLTPIEVAAPQNGEYARLGASRLRALALATQTRFDIAFDDEDADQLILKGAALGLYPVRPGEVGVVNLRYPFGHIQRYSAGTVGTTNDQAAFQLAINAVQTFSTRGGKVQLPELVKLQTGVTVSSYGVVIEGVGRRATQILCEPTINGLVFLDVINSNPLITIEGFTLRNVSFYSSGSGAGTNTFQKTAIRITDGSECHLEHVAVHYTWITAGNQNGNPSIGLQFLGRELSTFSKCIIYADLAIDIQANPRLTGYPTPISLDGCHFEDLVTCSLASTMANFRIGVGCGTVDNTSWECWIALAGKYAMYWNDTACVSDTICLKVDTFRWEQAADATGSCFYISRNAHLLYNIAFNNVSLGTTSDGFFLRNTVYITVIGVQYANGTGKKFFDVDATVRSIFILNAWVLVGSAYSFTNHTLVFGGGRTIFVDTAHIPIAYYEADVAGLSTGALFVGNKIIMQKTVSRITGGATDFGIENSTVLRTNFRVADSGADMQLFDGTRDFRVFLTAGFDEMSDGCHLISSANGISIIPGRSGPTTQKGVLGYFDGGTYRSAVEWANVVSGRGTLDIMRTGGTMRHGGRHISKLIALAFNAGAPTPDALLGNEFELDCTTNAAYVLQAPLNPATGQEIAVTVKNTSGGALLGAGLNAVYKSSGVINPANGQNITVVFYCYDGVNWRERSRAVGIPN